MAFDPNQSTYTRLRQSYAERRKPLTFWIGAGLSQPAGLPNWGELRQSLASEALEALALMEPGIADREEANLTAALHADDLWEAFGTIKRIMGDANYTASIRNIFAAADDLPIPASYNAIWRLDNVLGMVSLNIDRFSDRSFAAIRQGRDVASFVGRDAHAYAHMIGAQKPFVANLHGVHQAASSWIFTKPELKNLVDGRYRAFLTTLFASTTVVFCGISAEDLAAGGFIAGLAGQGIDLGEHYWVTSRKDQKALTWAADANVQIVRYSASTQNEHEAAILSLAADLRKAKSKDGPAAVVVPNIESKDIELEVRQLRTLDDDDLRTALSSHAKGILERGGNSTDSDEYREFISNYSPAIHQAWHVTNRKPFNSFYGLEVTEKISAGSFSNVWRLKGDAEGDYALKILVIDNLDAGPSIESFRRGVQSLGYLTRADVPGTARLISAYEIPTAVVMRFIEGGNLYEVIKSRSIEFWSETIGVLIAVCVHLKHGHNLPHSVLHRDVRPSNIMLPYIYWEESSAIDAGVSKYEAMLINYDMSWHTDAKGTTIPGNLSEAGFYAPEQLSDEQSMSRSTLVDSYGLGMTIYYGYTRSYPPTGGSRSSDWEETLKNKFRPQANSLWRSGPERLRRLIYNATMPEQNRRIDVSKVEAELSILQVLYVGTRTNVPSDFWAEELISRVTEREYTANIDGTKFSIELRQGRTIEVSSDLSHRSVDVRFRNMGTDGSDWKDADKIWKEKLERAKSMLTSSGWEVTGNTRYAHMDILLHLRLPIQAMEDNLDRVVDSLRKGIDQVRLD